MRRLTLVVLLAAGCAPELPDPQSPGAGVMRRYCASCHPVYSPASMTFPMWEMKLDAMRRTFAQRGIPWLPAADEQTLIEYLRSHAGG